MSGKSATLQNTKVNSGINYKCRDAILSASLQNTVASLQKFYIETDKEQIMFFILPQKYQPYFLEMIHIEHQAVGEHPQH